MPTERAPQVRALGAEMEFPVPAPNTIHRGGVGSRARLLHLPVNKTNYASGRHRISPARLSTHRKLFVR
jgi:hypothetical protein